MRLSLAPRREACQRIGRGGQERVAIESGLRRNQAVAASETVALVLDEGSPLPESAADVEELALRLRGHISQLGVLPSPGDPALCRAQRLSSESVPEGFVPSRVYLVRLAKATQELLVIVQSHGIDPAKPTRRRRWWKARINVLRGAVFAVAIACLILAASVPRS